jgi:hypothetical protein
VGPEQVPVEISAFGYGKNSEYDRIRILKPPLLSGKKAREWFYQGQYFGKFKALCETASFY